MNEVATSQDENALIAESSQARPQTVVKGWGLAAVNAQLNNGHIGGWEEVNEYRPRSMVQPPVGSGNHTNGREQLLNPSGKHWTPGRRGKSRG